VPALLPDWVVHLIALVIHFILERAVAASAHRDSLPSWWNYRAGLPPGSVQQLAASRRGAFGTAIAWMCRGRGIGPGHPDWPELSRAIVAFGGSIKGFRPGLPALGLQWWENPHIVEGMIGETVATPAADAMALLVSRHATANAPVPAEHSVPADPRIRPPPLIARQVFARASTGPPTGPPRVWGIQFLSCLMHGAGARLAPPSRFVPTKSQAERSAHQALVNEIEVKGFHALATPHPNRIAIPHARPGCL
jgi:hypothetical protein